MVPVCDTIIIIVSQTGRLATATRIGAPVDASLGQSNGGFVRQSLGHRLAQSVRFSSARPSASCCSAVKSLY
jgi:hypothetical protein